MKGTTNALFLSMILLLIAATSGAQAPAWVDFAGRQRLFPSDTWVTGFVTEINYGKEEESTATLERLSDYARTELIEGVLISIHSVNVSNILIQNQSTYQYFRKSSTSVSSLEVPGLVTETYYDKKKKTCYAFCYALRQDISGYYLLRLHSDKARIENHLANARKMNDAGNRNDALKALYSCFQSFRSAEEAQAIVLTISNFRTKAEELFIEDFIRLKGEVDNMLRELLSGSGSTIDDLAFNIAFGLKIQTEALYDNFRLTAFTFEDTKTATPFSQRLMFFVEQKMASIGLNVSLAGDFDPDGQQADTLPRLTGTYWIQDNALKIIAVVHDPLTGQSVASAEGSLPTAWCITNQIVYEPVNPIDPHVNPIINNQIAGSGLVVDLSTNKGRENLVYTEGDTLRLFVKANSACYLRFIYHLADGSKVLLLDNFYVDQEHINQFIRLPYEFLCYPPFGAEVLQLVACSQRFENLNYYDQDGYKIIRDDLNKVLFNLRNFVPAGEGQGIDEKQLLITTLPRHIWH